MMSFADKMQTVAVYALMDGSLRVVHEACGSPLVEDVVEVRWPDIASWVARHTCTGV